MSIICTKKLENNDSVSCRVCLKTSSTYYEFDTPMDFQEGPTFDDAIREVTKNAFKAVDSKTIFLICSSCADELKTAFHFIQKVQNTEKLLNSQNFELKLENSNLSDLFYDSNLEFLSTKEVEFLSTKEEIEDSLLEPMNIIEHEEVITLDVKDSFESTDDSFQVFIEESGFSGDEEEESPPFESLGLQLHCSPCNKTFESQESMNNHQTWHLTNDHNTSGVVNEVVINPPSDYEDDSKEEERLKCPLCEKFSLNRHVLIRHMKAVHRDSSDLEEKIAGVKNITYKRFLDKDETQLYQCESCDKKFLHHNSLVRHRYNVHEPEARPVDNQVYYCDECRKEFTFKSSMIRHKVLVHGHDKKDLTVRNIEINCEFCDKKIAKRFYERHCRINHKVNLVEKVNCEMCNKLVEKDWYQEHLDNHQNYEIDGEADEYICNICEINFGSMTRLIRHNNSAHRNIETDRMMRDIECSICGCVVKERFYSRHLDHVHKMPMNTEKVKCEECGKMIVKLWMNQHKLNHRDANEEEKFQCTICTKVYNTARILRAHVKRSHNKKKGEFKCTHCRMVFNEKQSLREHIRNHAPVDKQHCEICNREFQNRYTLKVHMKLHIGGEFECTFCKKRFTNARDLDIHTRFHTGDYPYKCDLCGKKFNIKSHLNTHMEVHLDNQYDCPSCDYTCKTKASIRQHRFIHEGMPHTCHFCGKGFNARNKIKAHLRSFHGKEITDEQFDKMHPKKNIIRDRDMGFQSDEDILGAYLGNTGELEEYKVLNDGIVFEEQTNFAIEDYFDS